MCPVVSLMFFQLFEWGEKSSFFVTVVIRSVQENVWPSCQRSHTPSFDVAPVFVHQRRRSARSHSTICLLLNPSLWLASSSIVCVLLQGGWKTCGLVHTSRAAASGCRVNPALIRCDFSPGFNVWRTGTVWSADGSVGLQLHLGLLVASFFL